MKYLTHIAAILFFLALIVSGCDFNTTTRQEKNDPLDASGQEISASANPQKQVKRILAQAQPLSTPSGGESPRKTRPRVIKATKSPKRTTLTDPALGEKVYIGNCSLCHDKGIAGAPLLGIKKDWANRISKNREILVKNAIKGFQGSKGVMPAKGGNPALSDADIEAAVIYMLESLNLNHK